MIQGVARVALVAAAMLVAPAPALAQASASAPPNLGWSPTTSAGGYDFGVLDAGAGGTRSVTFTLSNSGGKASGAIAVSLPGSGAFTVTADSCSGTSLGPQKSCHVTAAYAPTSSGEVDSASLTATGTQASGHLALAGKAGSPSLAWSPASHDFGTVNVGDTVTQSFTLTNSGAGTSGSLTTSLTGSSAMSVTADGCNATKLAAGNSCNVTVAYGPTQGATDSGTLAAGGVNASLSGAGAAQNLTATIGVTDCGGTLEWTLNNVFAQIVQSGEDSCLQAEVENAPAAGVTYQWVMNTPGTRGYLFNPDQTTASVLLRSDSVPDFYPEAISVTLTVTPKNGTPSVTVTGFMRYQFSQLTIAQSVQDQAAGPQVTAQASASTIPVAGSLTITQSYVQHDLDDPIAGTVTYSSGGQTLGTSTTPLDQFVIQGSALGIGSHTITVSYAIWNGIAYAPYSVDIPIVVTP